MPASASILANMITVGVLPAPPSVKFPTHMTGSPAETPFAAMRLAATAPYVSPSGASTPAVRPASCHQKAGSRMTRPLLQLQLHQIGVERCKRAIECPAQVLHNAMCCRHHAGTGVCVVQPCRQMRNEPVHAFHPLCAMNVVERGIDFREVPDMRTVQDRRSQLCSLDRILTAVLDQRAANKHHRCRPIDQTKLADCVGDIDLGFVLG